MIRQLVAPVKSKLNLSRLAGLRDYLIYALLVMILFALIARLDGLIPYESAVMHLAGLMLIALLAGMLQVWILGDQLLTKKAIWVKSLAIVGGNLLGMIAFIIASRAISFSNLPEIYRYAYLPALLTYTLPWLWLHSVLNVAGVPRISYSPMMFDSLKDMVAEIHFVNEARGIRWVFEDDFYELDASGTYQMRTYTPDGVKTYPLGTLFKGALSLHNHNLSPQQPIHFKYRDEEQKERAYGWQFYHYPYWFWPARQVAMNPEQKIKTNDLRFRRITAEERMQSTQNLHKNFKVATIYVKRTK